ncbi:Kelch repeat-containing protein [Paraburkholderia sp. BR14263]|uniref:Kelch repeat-containing protein n=1 Tax=unclassified Paraburkholderia TaxID=2615204 RepID=UPI0034CF3A31
MAWTNEPSLGDARNGLAAVTADASAPGSGYRIYAVGGSDGNEAVATVESYDTLAKNWKTVNSMNTVRLNLAIASSPGRVYAIGGSDGGGPLATHEIYDLAADTWSAAPSLPTARDALGAATGRDGRIYAIGGFNGAYLATVEAYDPSANDWITRAPMPTGRSNLAVVAGPDGLIYAIGGQNANGVVDVMEIFDPVSNSWVSGVSLPAPRWALASAVGPDGLIYAIGGIGGNGEPQATVYSYDPTTNGPWTVEPSLLTAQGLLAADTGPDGLIYAIGGQNFSAPALSTVEAFRVSTNLVTPDPYIGNGTYQSPDIILLDPSNNPVPLGGAPGGAWDTLLLPNTYYGIQTVIYNDSNVAATNTVVRFWHFLGGVGTAGAQVDEQVTTVPANGSVTVSSANPFLSGGAGQHECVAVSIANPESLYFNVDPMNATDVIDPTVAHPPGSSHFGSAWRNTNSTVLGQGARWLFPFQVSFEGAELASVRVVVTASRVPAGWEHVGAIAELRRTLDTAGVNLRMPLFLVPEIRSHLQVADMGLKIHLSDSEEEGERTAGVAAHRMTLKPGQKTSFSVSGTVPHNARPGDVFLVNVEAHYPSKVGRRPAVVEYLEVVYVK